VDEPGAALREMRRIVKPGGRVLVVDMFEHERVEYRHTMGHRRLGFSEEAIARDLRGAGLTRVRVIPLAGDPEARGPGLFAALGSVPEHEK
jgi:ArsR family transcriptional regulator